LLNTSVFAAFGGLVPKSIPIGFKEDAAMVLFQWEEGGKGGLLTVWVFIIKA
jgi:hypothetical protein